MDEFDQAKLKQKRTLDFRKHNVLWSLVVLQRLEDFLHKKRHYLKTHNIETLWELLRKGCSMPVEDVAVFATGTREILDRHRSHLGHLIDPDHDRRRQIKVAMRIIKEESAELLKRLREGAYIDILEYDKLQAEIATKRIELQEKESELEGLEIKEDFPVEVWELFQRPTQDDLVKMRLAEKDDSDSSYFVTRMGFLCYHNARQLGKLVLDTQNEMGILADEEISKIWSRLKSCMKNEVSIPFDSLLKKF